MRLRTQLVLAFFLLAVVPLAGVTVFSYLTTLRAFRGAVEAETRTLAEDMGRRLEAARTDLGQRLERLGELPFPSLLADAKGEAEEERLLGRVEAELGRAGELVESLEFVPQARPPATSRGSARREPRPAPSRHRMRILVGPGSPPPPGPAVATPPGSAHAAATREQTRLLLGRDFSFTVRRRGEAVGRVQAQVRSQQLLLGVLARTRQDRGEIPFALDGQGRLYATGASGASRLQALGIAGQGGAPRPDPDDWVVVTRRDEVSGLTLGIARPLAESLKEIRRAALLNLASGMGIVGIALLGILPLSRRMTRDLASLTEGAEKLARGELETRVPVRSADEFGRLAVQFNRMAQELRSHQDRLLERERLRKELEMCRRIQEELLPRDPLRVPLAEVEGVSIPAREVGGDFFNYFALDAAGGELALLVGDVSGKGVPAALLMANVQATLRARLPLERDLSDLARRLDEEIFASTPPPVFLTLFMGIMDTHRGALRWVNAGHNTQFLLRAEGGLEVMESTGRPIGLYPGGGYEQRSLALRAGDCLFLFTDGLVEAENEAGEPFGMQRLQELLLRERTRGLDRILSDVEAAVAAYRGPVEAGDDATMVVLKVNAGTG
jgi:serine phosphatase RsbU (regulator of sigma subunit)